MKIQLLRDEQHLILEKDLKLPAFFRGHAGNRFLIFLIESVL